MKLEFIDVTRAFFQAKAKREVYVELPEEDETTGMWETADIDAWNQGCGIELGGTLHGGTPGHGIQAGHGVRVRVGTSWWRYTVMISLQAD